MLASRNTPAPRPAANPALRGLFLLLVIVAGSTVAGDEYETRYLDGLRARRLFTIAERYCRETLTQELPQPQRAMLAIELSRTLVEHGKYKSTAERTGMWTRAREVLEQHGTRIRTQPWPLRLESQKAVNLGNQAAFLAWQAQVTPHDQPLREQAEEEIDKAIAALQAASETAEATSSQTDGMTAYARGHLRDTLRLHHGRALLDRVRLAAVGSAERVGSAIDAEQVIKRLTTSAADLQTRTLARVMFAECQRERGYSRRAADLLKTAFREARDDASRDRVVAEQVRMMLFDRQPDLAAEKLIAWRRERGSLTGELHLLRTRTLVELWRIASARNQSQVASELQQQIESGIDYAQKEVGGYWAWRCERLLESAREVGSLGETIAGLKREAGKQYAAGDLTGAAESLQGAAEQAEREGQSQAAFDMRYQQASILIEQRRIDVAEQVLRDSLSRSVGAPRQADAHLTWAWCLGQLYLQKKTRERRLAYMDALAAHRRQFESAETFGTASFMLGRLEEVRRQNTRAVSLYRDVPPDHKHRAEADAGLARCYAAVLARLQELGRVDDLPKWEQLAAEDLAPRLAALPDELKAITCDHAELAVQAAIIMLRLRSPDAARAEELLTQSISAMALQQKPNSPTAARAAKLAALAERWRLLALVGLNRFGDALNQADQLATRDTAELLSLLQTLEESRNTVAAEQRIAFSSLRLRIGEIANTRRSSLSPEQQSSLDVYLVQIYADSGKTRQAVSKAKSLLNSSGPDRTALIRMADTLRDLNTRDATATARLAWKQVENVTTAGSQEWLEARLEVARCTLALGEQEDCRKLLKLTQLLYPELGNEALRRQYATLEKQLGLEN